MFDEAVTFYGEITLQMLVVVGTSRVFRPYRVHVPSFLISNPSLLWY